MYGDKSPKIKFNGIARRLIDADILKFTSQSVWNLIGGIFHRTVGHLYGQCYLPSTHLSRVNRNHDAVMICKCFRFTGPLWGNPPVTDGFLSQRTSFDVSQQFIMYVTLPLLIQVNTLTSPCTISMVWRLVVKVTVARYMPSSGSQRPLLTSQSVGATNVRSQSTCLSLKSSTYRS